MALQLKIAPSPLTREADRLYGELLLILAILSAAAPLFVEATLAWSLLTAGIAGVWWIAVDRTPRGLLAGVAWAVIALALGLQLTFHLLIDVLPLDLALGGGFVLLGVAELWLGLERYRRRPAARIVMVVGGAVAVVFGVSAPLVWPSLPNWAGAATVALMMGGFGAGLLIGSLRLRRARDAPAADVAPEPRT
ncbi:MAG TPA: hypothetical protein VKT30_14980 [Caulobacteraceae bacterium]|nr:hypothetical protein [Caulobacteraceae bacterium]